ncbi:hypothetical protein BK709_19000 [Bacillus thuringiensis serovar shandongiensis]|uniref:hypothetical protein n=1 Tax=Bacillus toyonensis TaxID=155322 RepID=UPI000B45034E|nr:hypothetical protein [Bacillus toyonensis]MEC2392624.1 hypothetical protein [Bacillus toyonensis]OTX40554.1 hypothetical protein BK717_04410 [Bacillus thuringiensis serovar malayensis]OUB04973.1 hypothetical protein BK709_19000 [Bacillus thuringiensis serovar shandongiensis]
MKLNVSMLPISSQVRQTIEKAYTGTSQMEMLSPEAVLEVLAELKHLGKPISDVGLQRERPQLYTALTSHFDTLEKAASLVQLPKIKVKSLAKQEREHNKYLLGVC